jgi:transposase
MAMQDLVWQDLVCEATSQRRDAVDPAALAPRSACSARPSWPGQPGRRPLRDADEKHNALARRLIDRQDDYLRFTRDWQIENHDPQLLTIPPDGCL